MSVSLSLLFGTTICGALLCLSWIAWQQKLELDEIRIVQRTQEVASGNKLALLEQLTCYDALTGLRNQRMFEEELAIMLRNRTPLALIYIDLDGLKQINTQRGHQEADKVIRSAAKAIRASLQRRTDRKHGCSHMTTDDLERAAELEMERAKADGRNCVRAPVPPIPQYVESSKTKSHTGTERIAA